MPSLAPMTPGNTVAIAVTATSVATLLPTRGGGQIIVTSPLANNIAFIAFGSASTTVVIPTTAQNGCPILPGTAQTFTVPPGNTHVAVIGTVASTLYFTVGDGE